MPASTNMTNVNTDERAKRMLATGLVLSMILMSLASMTASFGKEVVEPTDRLEPGFDGERMRHATQTTVSAGDQEEGGYHLTSNRWWEGKVAYIPSVDDADGDGLDDVDDPYPWDRNIAHHNRNCNNDCEANDLLNIVDEPELASVESMRESSLGDMDQDGDLDIVFLNGCQLYILPNRLGSLTSQVIHVTGGLCDGYAIRLADLDGDGDLDVYVGSWFTAYVVEMNGTASVQTTQLFANSGGSDAKYIYDSASIGDVNGDGLADILLGAHYSYYTTVLPSARLLVNEYDGNGLSFNNTWNYTATSGAWDVMFLDYDSDGDDDVMITAKNGSHHTCSGGGSDCNVVAFFNAGANGSLNETADISLEILFWTIGAADMNEDGRVDILGQTNGGNVWLHYNLGADDGFFTEDTWHRIHQGDDDAMRISVADVNADGLHDVILHAMGGSDDSSILLHDGLYAYDTSAPTWSLAWSIDAGARSRLSIGDYDGNGFPDILVTPRSTPLSVYRNGGGVLETTVSQTLVVDPADGGSPRGVGTIADVDGDGSPDIVVGGTDTIGIHHNDGDGGFNETPDDTIDSSFTYAVTTADFNDDGYPELVSAESGSGIMIRWGSADGYNSTADIEIEPSGQTQGWGTIIAEDMDLDGDIDLLFDGRYGGGTKAFVYAFDGDDGFDLRWSSLASNDSVSGYPHQTILADVNDDGIHDIVRCLDKRVYLYGGGWQFVGNELTVNHTVNGPGWIDTGAESCGSGDYDEDGDTDLVLQFSSYVKLRLGPSFSSGMYWHRYTTQGLDLADIDFDGKDELLVSTSGAKKSRVYDLNPVSGGMSLSKIWEGGGYRTTETQTVADLNMDGIPDMVQFNWYQNTDFIFGMSDIDTDGVEDANDEFIFDPTQAADSDGDGYGDSPNGYLPDQCQYYWGDSTEDRRGCPDQDGDGWSDLNDAFWRDSTQWADTDGDGFGDNYPLGSPAFGNRAAHWPGEAVAGARNPDHEPLDFDDDGYEDPDLVNDGAIAPYDDCVLTPGDSFIDEYGCLDSDYDGMSNAGDFLPMDPSQMNDTDGDGFGDNPNGTMGDACPLQFGTSIIDRYGCIDADDDGWSALNDLDDNDPLEQEDRDNDTIGDNADQCPYSWSNLTTGPHRGCPDTDGDGYADMVDAFDSDPTQWMDSDLDGRGDNPAGTNPDAFPQDPSQWEDSDGDTYGDNPSGAKADAFPNDASQSTDTDGDGYGNNASGTNPDRCATEAGTSTIRLASDGNRSDFFGCLDNDSDGVADLHDDCPTAAGASYTDRFACPDSDEDSISDQNDPYPYSASSGVSIGDWDDDGLVDRRPAHGLQGPDIFPDDRTQNSDRDGDGYGDNSRGDSPDLFPDDDTQWADSDGDGYGDQEDGTDGDGCIFEAGNSTDPVHGCPDADGDGRADGDDAFPNDARQKDDSDGDGYGDDEGNNRTDDCPEQWGDSTLGERGCPDIDGDGWSDHEDQCPNQAGHSGHPYTGCLDRDGDGIADQVDDFPDDVNETRDSDGDGLGDVGDPYPDDFDNDGLSTDLDWDDEDPTEQYDRDDDGVGDNADHWPDDPTRWSDADGDGYADQAGLEESDNCPSTPGTSTLFQLGCSDIDGDGMPDVLDPDIDGDGVTNDNELDASRGGVYFDPFNASSTPPDMDGDDIPDILDFDKDGDGFPNSFEEERGSSSSNANSTPFSQYGDTNTGLFYIPGEGFQSEYSPEGTELSVSMVIDLITSEYLAVVLMAPLTIFALLRKRRRYKKMRRKLNEAFTGEELEGYEPEIDRLILKGKVRVEHGVLLRNLFERRREELDENESQTATVPIRGGAETGSSAGRGPGGGPGGGQRGGGVQRAGGSRPTVGGSSRPNVGGGRSGGVTRPGGDDRRGSSRDDDYDDDHDDDYDDEPRRGGGGGRGPGGGGRGPGGGGRGRSGGSGGGVVRREGGVRRRKRSLPGDGRY